jgi:hypothetical protein
VALNPMLCEVCRHARVAAKSPVSAGDGARPWVCAACAAGKPVPANAGKKANRNEATSLSFSLSLSFFHLSDTLCSPCAGCEICVRKKREAKVTLVDRTFLLCKACALTQQSKAATPALREQTPETDGWDDAVRGAHDLDVWRWIKRRCLRVCRAQSLEAAQSLSLASTADEFGSVLQTHLFIAMSSDPELSTDRMLAGARRIMSDLPTLFAVVNQLFPLADTAISIVGCDVHVLFRIEENWLRLVDRHKLPLPMRAVGAVVPPPPAAADADSSSNSDRERPTTQWHAGDLQKSRSVTISRDNAALNRSSNSSSSSKGPPPAVAPRRNQTFIDGVQARDRAQLTPMYAAGPTRPRSDSVNSVDSIGEPPPPPEDDLTVVDWAAAAPPVPAKDDEFSRSDDDDDDDGEEPPPPVHVEDDDEDEAPPVPPVVTPRTAAAATATAAPIASRSARALAQSAAPAPARATSPPVPRRPTADAPAPARVPALQSVSRSPPRRPSDPSATRRPSDPPSTSPTTSPRGLASPRLPQRSDAASPTPPPARSAPAGAATRSVPPATTAGAPPPLAVVASPSARVAIPAPQRQALPARQPRQAPQQAPARPAAPTRQPSVASPIVRRAARQPTGAVRGPSPASPAVPRAQAPPATALAASDPAVPSADADSDDEAPPRPPSADSDDDAPPATLAASDSYQQLPKAPSRMQYCELPQDPSARDDRGDNGDLPEPQDLSQSSVQYQELPKANAIVYEQLPPTPAVQYEALPQNQNGAAAAPQYDKLPQRDTQNIDDDARAATMAAAAAQYAELPLRATDAIDADAAAVKHSTVVITPIPGKQAARTQVNLPVRRAAATTPARGPPVRTPPGVAAAPSRPVGQPGVAAPTRSRRAPLAVPRRGSAPTPITRSSQKQAAATDEDDDDDILGMIEQGAQHAQHEWTDLQRNGGDSIVDVEELSE